MYTMAQFWMISTMICATFLQKCLMVESLGAGNSDKIVSLPAQPKVTFQQYAGYVTVNNTQRRALFYYFVEAETDPASKPLVLWLTGGPGCSSVGAGAFIEHGPFRLKGDILVKNEYSWNKVANMLYVESPAGVGFSYSANKSFYSYVDDEIAARDAKTFLTQWFLKFPQYKSHDLYISGDSYGGHYVPQLALLLSLNKSRYKLKGIAVGNPLLEFNTDINSRDEYFWSHGLISDATYKHYTTSVCNSSQLMREEIRLILTEQPLSHGCNVVNKLFSEEIPDAVDKYDVTADICLSTSTQSQSDILNLRSRTQISASRQVQPNAANNKRFSDEDVCIQETTAKYLNRKDVQNALHAQLVGITSWKLCRNLDELVYDPRNREIPTIGIVGSLVKSGIRALVYSGDQDSVIPFTGTRALVKGLATQLKLELIERYRPWFVEKQVGGWIEVHDKLTFATIRGAAHLAPFNQPERSLALFKAFLAGISPPKD